MGLGLAGSCFADADPVSGTATVTFNATVQAAACNFTVRGVGETTNVVNFGTVPWSTTAFPKQKMEFKLDCVNGVSFNNVDITGAETQRVSTNQGAFFAVYNNEDVTEAWDGQDAISFAKADDTDSDGAFTAYKWVQFEMTNETVVGDHTASVVYTATYQ